MSCEYYTALQQRVDTDILSRRNSFAAGEFGTVDSLKVKVKVAQSCPTLRPQGLYNPWILQAITLEWIAFPFSRGSSQPRNRTQFSRIAGRFFIN